MPTTTQINFGYGLDVTDEGGGVITVDSSGAAGPTGPAGPSGPAGPGVPTGGTAGQVLTKDTTTDYDTSWQAPTGGGGLPAVGANGEVLTVVSGAWASAPPTIEVEY
jgi:hypothetical protein